MTETLEDRYSADISKHELEAELDRLDTVVESIESMSRYLGVANGAIVFSLISFVGSLLGGRVEIAQSVRWLVITSVALSLISAALGLISLQEFGSFRRNIATAQRLFSNQRFSSADRLIGKPPRRTMLILYGTCAFTSSSAALAFVALFGMVLL